VYLPLLLENENGITHANDWANGFLRGMELRKEHWADLLDDEEHGGSLIPIFALAHENDSDPSVRPYKEPINAEMRETLIVGAAAGMNKIFHYFEAQRLLGTKPLDNMATFRRSMPKIGRNDRVLADQRRNSSIAVARQHCIKLSVSSHAILIAISKGKDDVVGNKVHAPWPDFTNQT